MGPGVKKTPGRKKNKAQLAKEAKESQVKTNQHKTNHKSKQVKTSLKNKPNKPVIV